MKDIPIICVDDEKIILDSLKIQLTKNFGSDYFYDFAESAEEALEIIENLQKDEVKFIVIVSDWLMPGMKGDKFLIEIIYKYQNVANIMLTGQADQKAIDNAFNNANLLECITKPWTEEKLINTITQALNMYLIFKHLIEKINIKKQ